MTTRKTILGASLLLAAVTVAGAAERTRSADPTIANPTSGEVEINGQTQTVNADGSVLLADVMGTYGSVLAYQIDQSTADVMRMRGSDDTLVLANGAVPLLEDFVSDPSAPIAISVEGHKKNVEWMEEDFDGTTVVTFADGAVIQTAEQTPHWVTLRTTVPHFVDTDGSYVYANGAALFDEPLATSNQ